PLTPDQCALLNRKLPLHIVVQSSPDRCFSDEDYRTAGSTDQEDIANCDILLAVKEVPVAQLLPRTIYFFFSHTIKKQAHNRKLLQEILKKEIRLVDYEMHKDNRGQRVIAFGKFAGMVGAHNALWTYAMRTGAYSLKRM